MNNGKSNSRNNKSSRSGGSKNSTGRKTYSKEGGAGERKFSKPLDRKPKPKAKPQKEASEADGMRLNKYISNSGVCSRREADIYIVSGNVKINGEVVVELGHRVMPGDVVNFDGTLITPEKKIYVLLNKPKGFATLNESIISAENVLSLVKSASKTPLAPVGRMDKTTMGLMLFTNDSNLLQKLNSPEQRSSKLYQVSIDKNLKYEDLEKIKKGLYIDEKRVFVEEIAYVEDQPKTEIGIKLKASNVKLVRALFESLDYNVIKVDRVMYGPLTKWNLPRGKWRFLTEEEVSRLKNG
ncbi:MAG: rRNA pseudouridine synthase [Flavobacteriaceae bacterium]|jgi:23S rRNA pseudouridine2605 synthase|nr:rRNA pseudouridine synthase [Flavobacteriaceae bacterium]